MGKMSLSPINHREIRSFQIAPNIPQRKSLTLGASASLNYLSVGKQGYELRVLTETDKGSFNYLPRFSRKLFGGGTRQNSFGTPHKIACSAHGYPEWAQHNIFRAGSSQPSPRASVLETIPKCSRTHCFTRYLWGNWFSPTVKHSYEALHTPINWFCLFSNSHTYQVTESIGNNGLQMFVL